MKKLIFILLFLPLLLLAQTPQEFKYQAVLRGANGDLLVNQVVSLKTSILSGSAVGNVEYEETHSTGTNGYGVASINIGSGTVLSGSFANIDWSSNTYYLKTELDITGGSSYQFMGTSQILSVPYALHSESASTSLDDNDKDATNEIQQLSIANDTVKLSNGGEVYLGSYLDNTDQQTLSLQGNQLVISNGNSVSLTGTVDLDADPSNELQVLSLSNDTLYLSNGNYVVLPPDNDGDPVNEIQNLSITGSDVSISGANTISLPANNDNDSSNELQNLTLSGGYLTISNGNTVTLPPDGDSDAANELQDLSISGSDISISNGNTITLPADGDSDSNNELQNLSINGSDISISNGNTVTFPPDADSDSTNELQSLSYSNDTLSISNGNQVTINTSSFDFIYPDGKSGIIPKFLFAGDSTWLNPSYNSQSWGIVQSSYERTYTVPNGKNFYLTSVNIPYVGWSSGGSQGQVFVNGNELYSGSSNEWNSNQQILMQNISQPIILGSGDVLRLVPPVLLNSNNYYPDFISVNGFLVDKKIDPITVSVGSYTVPQGKVFVVVNGKGSTNGARLDVNGKIYSWSMMYVTNNYVTTGGSSIITMGLRFQEPFFFNENDVISTCSGCNFVLNGYLIDK